MAYHQNSQKGLSTKSVKQQNLGMWSSHQVLDGLGQESRPTMHIVLGNFQHPACVSFLEVAKPAKVDHFFVFFWFRYAGHIMI